jgi:carboxyl-terminal processing protease
MGKNSSGRRSRCSDTIGVAVVPLMIGAMVLFPAISQPEPTNPSKGVPCESLLVDRQLLTFLEALSRIADTASFLPPEVSRDQMLADAIRAYLAARDPFSEYLTRDEYERFKDFQDDRYVGIGMMIEKDRDGNIVCLPAPGSAAERAGIRPGDQLQSINGVRLAGIPLLAVASLARGAEGTSADLVVARNGVERHLTLIRTAATIESVTKYAVGTMPILRVASFTPSTKGKLEAFLNDWDGSLPITIDLRGNAGGDLNAAIDCAGLLLPAGKLIVTTDGKTGQRRYESRAGATNLTSRVYLWQDGATASAAEVFVAALTQNRRAVSIGTHTFGKGSKQDVLELSDGSALVLTTGALLPPSGIPFHTKGLRPDYPLGDKPADTSSYVAKLDELLRTQNPGTQEPLSR